MKASVRSSAENGIRGPDDQIRRREPPLSNPSRLDWSDGIVQKDPVLADTRIASSPPGNGWPERKSLCFETD